MKPTIAEITAAVCRKFKLEPWMLNGNERHGHISNPRRMAFLLADEAGASHGQIAIRFRRNRSTVSKAIMAVKAKASRDFETAVTLENLRIILEWKTA